MRLALTLAALFALAPLAVAGPGPAAVAAGTAPTAAAPVPCRIPGIPARDRVLCGHVDVLESAASGRTIAVRYVLVRARGRNIAPVFEVVGGPGQSATAYAPGYAREGNYARLIGKHDLVFVDQRGTGRSRPLECRALYANHAHVFAELYPTAELKACRARLAALADLDAYGTERAADDFDAVRAALGYDQIEIEGGSFGAQFALVYLRRHPAHVRALSLEAIAPPDLKLPLPFSQGAQHALDELLASCAADATCSKAYPDLQSEWERVNARFARGPQTVTFTDLDGKRKTLRLAREVFADRLRQMLYDPYIASAVPAALHAAAGGDDAPLAQLVAFITDAVGGDIAQGMYMSVTCSEDVPFITPAEQARAARTGYLGDLRIRAQQRACALWNVRRAPASFLAPVRSGVPILMISGADDPATPPALGARLLPYLPNARQIVVPNGGHNNGGPCLERLRVAFLDDPRPRALQASCAAKQGRPPFVTDFRAWFARLRG
ncbi:MAG: hypothetical protein QOI11_3497 [Candidatus Eremiobacteraeota bacterium]|nr:hypothetical protein [Candidatus Eremiobacteraeota bacterium]